MTTALVMFGKEFDGLTRVHWLLYNFLPIIGRINEGNNPPVGTVGVNDFGYATYDVPRRNARTDYVFRLYLFSGKIPPGKPLKWTEVQECINAPGWISGDLNTYYP
jgi:phosphatidylethanolamine-binding protein (PEBP) family uncharacterized protein